MEALDAIFGRRSIGRLQSPGPDADTLTTILRAGAAAPDHQSLRPWKFVILQGSAKDQFGEVLAAAYDQRCAAAGKEVVPAKREKELTKLGRAPVVVIVAAIDRNDDKVPFIEQFAAAAAATQNMCLAASALGFGSMWRTGDPAYDENVKRAIGLAEADAIAAFLYLGTIGEGSEKATNNPSLDGLVEYR